jgi:release factor glutamine methyltransferase
MEHTVQEAVRLTEKKFAKHIEQPLAAQEAQWLVQHVCGLNSLTELITNGQTPLTLQQSIQLAMLVRERLEEQVPLGYVIGNVPFCGLTIFTAPPTLIPRMETEEWVTALIKKITDSGMQPQRIADLCTGSGCIALALAHHFPKATVQGFDVCTEALALCERNKKALGITNIQFTHADILASPLPDSYDLVVSNPPYLSAQEWMALEPEVREWEDQKALVAERDELAFYETLAASVHAPFMALEIGAGQKTAVSEILYANGWHEQEWFVDGFGKDRSVFCRKT